MPVNRWIIGGFLALAILPGLRGQTDLQLLGPLPAAVQESSGLLLSGANLITHNDSGNEALLFVLDTVSLAVLRQVSVSGVENTDWEDLAEDDNYIYIGDIGNNLGTRTDLKVLRVSKTEFANSDAVTAEVIAYNYEDQTDFSGGAQSDWDAEALIAVGDSLLIFTKQWQSGGTVVYSLPKNPGQYQARRVAQYNSGGLVTGAMRRPDGSGVVLLGYSELLQPFVIDIPALGEPFEFVPETMKGMLEIGFSQAEGIAADAEGRVFVSSEAFANAFLNLSASVFTFTWDQEETPPDTDPDNPDPGGEEPQPGGDMGLQPGELRIYREPGSPMLRYAVGSENALLARAVYDSAGRLILYEKATEAVPGSLDVSGLETAVYYLTLYLRGETLSEPFLRY